MTEIWLVLGVLCAVGAVVLVVIALDQGAAEKSRAVRLLETQVTGTGGSEQIDLREQEMSESFGTRVAVPIVTAASRVARRVTPVDARDRTATKLVLAGSPAGWDAERVLAFKVIGSVGGLILGLFVSGLLGLGTFIQVVIIALMTFAGFILPDSMLNRRVADRQHEIRRSLSDTLDLLTISVEAGLSLNASIAQVVQNVPGILSQEFARMLQEIQLGVPRSEAFRQLAERTDVEELNAFALAMIQADVFGVSVSSVLRTQSQQLRVKMRQQAEARAQQTPVKIVFPLILCILPALFVVIVGPGAIRIYQQFINA